MRLNRIKAEGPGYYLVTSRCTNKEFLLEDEVEKARFLDLARRAETFCGVSLLNFVIMDNHFHLMIKVPEPEEIDDAELQRRIEVLYGEKRAAAYLDQIRRNDELEAPLADTVTRESFLLRMYDISMYMKTLLERFSAGYNRRHNRVGPMWQGRFHSTLVEDKQNYLLTGCGYIDLNPVRAYMVRDPKEYGWSSYGRAVAGDKRARAGLMELMAQFGVKDWDDCQRQYRIYLYVKAQQVGMSPDDNPRGTGPAKS